MRGSGYASLLKFGLEKHVPFRCRALFVCERVVPSKTKLYILRKLAKSELKHVWQKFNFYSYRLQIYGVEDFGIQFSVAI